MSFNGHIVNFDSINHSYLINFDVSLDNLSIPKGSANVELKMGDTRVSIHDSEKYTLDTRSSKLLKLEFLKLIYSYNKDRCTQTIVHSNR